MKILTQKLLRALNDAAVPRATPSRGMGVMLTATLRRLAGERGGRSCSAQEGGWRHRELAGTGRDAQVGVKPVLCSPRDGVELDGVANDRASERDEVGIAPLVAGVYADDLDEGGDRRTHAGRVRRRAGPSAG